MAEIGEFFLDGSSCLPGFLLYWLRLPKDEPFN